jgi:hypothetical protein
MQLSQTELIGSMHDDGISRRHINAGLNNGRAQQHVILLMVKVTHHAFEFTFWELTVCDGNTCFWH